MRKTKIVCTLGPSTSSYHSIEQLVKKGMDVARLNCSHASHKELTKLVKMVRQASRAQARPMAILLDLQGPKIRTGSFPQGPVTIKAKSTVCITTKKMSQGCNEKKFSVDYPNLANSVSPGERILINDGKLELKVVKILNNSEFLCKVLVGGQLSSHKGINLPKTTLSITRFTKKDEEDLTHGLSLNVDYIALSFVCEPQDVLSLAKRIQSKKKETPIIAKIEKPEAIKHLDDIISVSDGIMIARGDMAVEISAQKVPAIQKKIIHKCNARGVPVILATQILESMTHSLQPTRAEASDVANGIFDGADALMLSGETASGKYPLQALQTMTDIIGQAERDWTKLDLQKPPTPPVFTIAESIEQAASQIALQSRARAICCITNSGKGAQALAKFRPPVPIFALTDKKEILQKLALIWGVKGILIPQALSTDYTFTFVAKTVVKWWNTKANTLRPIKKGDFVVITMGLPTLTRSQTNALKVHAIP